MSNDSQTTYKAVWEAVAMDSSRIESQVTRLSGDVEELMRDRHAHLATLKTVTWIISLCAAAIIGVSGWLIRTTIELNSETQHLRGQMQMLQTAQDLELSRIRGIEVQLAETAAKVDYLHSAVTEARRQSL